MFLPVIGVAFFNVPAEQYVVPRNEMSDDSRLSISFVLSHGSAKCRQYLVAVNAGKMNDSGSQQSISRGGRRFKYDAV